MLHLNINYEFTTLVIVRTVASFSLIKILYTSQPSQVLADSHRLLSESIDANQGDEDVIYVGLYIYSFVSS